MFSYGVSMEIYLISFKLSSGLPIVFNAKKVHSKIATYGIFFEFNPLWAKLIWTESSEHYLSLIYQYYFFFKMIKNFYF